MTKQFQFAAWITLVSKTVLISIGQECSWAGEPEKNMELPWWDKPHFILTLQQCRFLGFIANLKSQRSLTEEMLCFVVSDDLWKSGLFGTRAYAFRPGWSGNFWTCSSLLVLQLFGSFCGSCSLGSGLQPLRIRASRRFPSPDSALSNSAIAEALFQLNEIIPSSLSPVFFKVCAFLNELSSHINTNKL